MSTEKRDEILQAYVAEADPAKRRALLKQWAEAGGRELIDQAVSEGLKTLRWRNESGEA